MKELSKTIYNKKNLLICVTIVFTIDLIATILMELIGAPLWASAFIGAIILYNGFNFMSDIFPIKTIRYYNPE